MAEATTRTKDEHYDAVSVLYHLLQEGDTLDQYIDDARRDGDEELAQFFAEVQRDDRERAQRAKTLLKARL